MMKIEWKKVSQKCQKWRVFRNLEAFGQTVLPDRTFLELVKNVKIKKLEQKI